MWIGDGIAFPQILQKVALLLLRRIANAVTHRTELLWRIGKPVPDFAPCSGPARQAFDRRLKRALLLDIDSIVALDLVAECAPGRCLFGRSGSVRVGDPAQQIALLVFNEQAVEVVCIDVSLVPSVERQVEQAAERPTRGLVGARIGCHVEAKALVGIAKESRYRPVACLPALAKDIAAVLHLDERVKPLRQGEPFVDTTREHVIKKLIKFFKEHTAADGQEDIKSYSTVASPDLSHTKVLNAQIDGRAMLQPNWNSIMDRAINFAFHKLRDTDKVAELVLTKHTKGEKTDQGFRYLKEAGLSVQGQDSNNAWKTTANIIKALGVPAEVTFAWYDNPKAAKPGETGKFVFS